MVERDDDEKMTGVITIAPWTHEHDMVELPGCSVERTHAGTVSGCQGPARTAVSEADVGGRGAERSRETARARR